MVGPGTGSRDVRDHVEKDMQQVLPSMASFGRSSSFDVAYVTGDARLPLRHAYAPPITVYYLSFQSPCSPRHTRRPDKNEIPIFTAHEERFLGVASSTSFILESRATFPCSCFLQRSPVYVGDTFVLLSVHRATRADRILTNAKVTDRLFIETRSKPINKSGGSFTGQTSIHCWPVYGVVSV